MTRFCLVRHGTTDWNIEGKYQGQSNIPLNETGRIETLGLAKQLMGETFSAIYSSDLDRALQTAQIIGQYLDLPVVIHRGLREINQGEWEGKKVSEIRTHYLKIWTQRAQDPINARPPGGETLGEVAARVYAALDEISVDSKDLDSIICSHGITLAAIICKVRGISLGLAYEFIPENASQIWINWKNDSK